jgi:hypothetical protein
MQRAAFCQKFRPGRLMNGAIHPPVAQQRGVCRVHDGIYILLRDIALDYHDGFVVHIAALLKPQFANHPPGIVWRIVQDVPADIDRGDFALAPIHALGEPRGLGMSLNVDCLDTQLAFPHEFIGAAAIGELRGGTPANGGVHDRRSKLFASKSVADLRF